MRGNLTPLLEGQTLRVPTFRRLEWLSLCSQTPCCHFALSLPLRDSTLEGGRLMLLPSTKKFGRHSRLVSFQSAGYLRGPWGATCGWGSSCLKKNATKI